MKTLRTAVTLVVLMLALASCQSTPVTAVPFTQPVLLPVKYQGQEKYQLIREWEWEWCGNVEKAPAGLILDGASVPRPAWWFMPPDGLHRAAALSHDLAYIGRGKMPSGLRMTRAEADEMFYGIMLRAGVGSNRAKIAYAGVRAGGWVEWRRPYVGPVIIPVQQPLSITRKRSFFLTRHLYE